MGKMDDQLTAQEKPDSLGMMFLLYIKGSANRIKRIVKKKTEDCV